MNLRKRVVVQFAVACSDYRFSVRIFRPANQAYHPAGVNYLLQDLSGEDKTL